MFLGIDGRIFPKKDEKEKGEYSCSISYQECVLIEGKYLYGYATASNAYALTDKKENKTFTFPGCVILELDPTNVIDKFVIDQIGTDQPFSVQLRYDQSPKDQKMIEAGISSPDMAKLISQGILQDFQLLEKTEHLDPSKFVKPANSGGRGGYTSKSATQIMEERLTALEALEPNRVMALVEKWGLTVPETLTLLF